jgi:ADP-ribose pyrophosphatase
VAPAGEPQRLMGFEPLPGNVTAPMEVFVWRTFERIGEPSDPQEAARVEWVPLSGVVELAGRGGLLGAATVAALLYLRATLT